MERDNWNARLSAGTDPHAGEVGKPGMKLNILGVEITPDDSRLRGATNWTGVSGKTMLEQLSHHPGFWAIGGSEDMTGGGTGGSEDNHSPQQQEANNAPTGYEEGGKTQATQTGWSRPVDKPAPEEGNTTAGNGGMGEG